MRQVLQSARSGEIAVVEVPAPQLLLGSVLVQIAASLVSAGTERASSEFASKNILQKAKARPDLVRDVINKFRRDGIFSTIAAVRGRLDQPGALGYSSAGTVVATGVGIHDIQVGDRVACAGAGYAVHGEFACVPRLLVAKIPSADTSFEHAAFTTVGAVALHGIRTADVKFGDVVAVIGLGLLGQLTVQLLKAAGCRVLGMDITPARAALAAKIGADAVATSASEFHAHCLQYSSGHGVDAVLIAAETSSSEPVNLAAEVARDRGKVVAVGTVGLEIQRRLYYEKELDFRIPRSYGPGRYDSAYEQKGRDYPIGYVRWTETRNMEAFLQALSEGKLNLELLITHRFPIENARDAYEVISGSTREPYLGVLITYPESSAPNNRIELSANHQSSPEKSVNIGLLGAGAFATGTLLPAMKHVSGLVLTGVCAANGFHSRYAAEKFGFRYCATGEEQILGDPNINTVVIATRNNLHAKQVQAALNAGKHVFCEKPLCLSEEELSEVVRAYACATVARQPNLNLMVGFNRRFAPMAVRMKEFLAAVGEPLALHYRVNVGYLPPDHWINDADIGGGRILGEGCHFIDFLGFLAGALPVEVQTRSLANSGQYLGDNVIISLRFANGSQGTISYLANGDKSYSKERIEVFGGGAVAVLDDFRHLELVRNGKKQIMHSRFQKDKGHRGEWQALARTILEGAESPIPFTEIVAATLTTLRANESVHCGQPISIDVDGYLSSLQSAERESSQSAHS